MNLATLITFMQISHWLYKCMYWYSLFLTFYILCNSSSSHRDRLKVLWNMLRVSIMHFISYYKLNNNEGQWWYCCRLWKAIIISSTFRLKTNVPSFLWLNVTPNKNLLGNNFIIKKERENKLKSLDYVSWIIGEHNMERDEFWELVLNKHS